MFFQNPGERINFCFLKFLILFLKLYSICLGVINPGLKIHTLPTKFKTVDSIPIFEIPPSKTLILF